MALGKIVTYYSWKGGVGRSMALANTALQLARGGATVLMIDWDLEAPGLRIYFESGDFSINAPAETTGLIGWLNEVQQEDRLEKHAESRWRQKISIINAASSKSAIPDGKLHLLCAGQSDERYSRFVQSFSWESFFAKNGGGERLEHLREQFRNAYDFILIDSRTGLTDSGGVCTVQMPDVLILVFTANSQSLSGGVEAAKRMQEARKHFSYDRAPMKIVPLLSRWDGKEEVDRASEWLARASDEIGELISNWFPKAIQPIHFFQSIRIPYVAAFSFGEQLPVLHHSLFDPDLPGLYYSRLAKLLASDFGYARDLLGVSHVTSNLTSIKLLSKLAEEGKYIGKISSGDGTPIGTGFLAKGDSLHASLGSQAVFITATHVLDAIRQRPSAAVRVEFPQLAAQFRYVALSEVVWASNPDEFDISVLRLDPPPPLPARGARIDSREASFLGEEAIDRGPKVFAMGYATGEDLALSEGPLRSLSMRGGKRAIELVQYDIATEPGMAGAPVYDKNLNVIAVHRASTADGSGRGVSMRSLRDAIARQKARDEEKPLTIRELAADVGVDIKTIKRLINKQELPKPRLLTTTAGLSYPQFDPAQVAKSRQIIEALRRTGWKIKK